MDWMERLKHSTGNTKMNVAEKSNTIFNNFMKVLSKKGRHVLIQTDDKLHMVEEAFFKNNFGLDAEMLERASKMIVEQHSGKVIKNTFDDLEDMFTFR